MMNIGVGVFRILAKHLRRVMFWVNRETDKPDLVPNRIIL